MAPPVKDKSVAEFAEDQGVSSQRVYQWIQAGMPHRKRKTGTRIVSAEANKWLREFARNEGRQETGLDEGKERARKVRAEADLKELEVAERRRQMIPASELEEFCESFVGGFAAVAAGRLQRFEREIVKASTAGEARRITQQIHTALMEGAQAYAQQLDAEAEEIERTENSEAPAA